MTLKYMRFTKIRKWVPLLAFLSGCLFESSKNDPYQGLSCGELNSKLLSELKRFNAESATASTTISTMDTIETDWCDTVLNIAYFDSLIKIVGIPQIPGLIHSDSSDSVSRNVVIKVISKEPYLASIKILNYKNQIIREGSQWFGNPDYIKRLYGRL